MRTDIAHIVLRELTDDYYGGSGDEWRAADRILEKMRERLVNVQTIRAIESRLGFPGFPMRVILETAFDVITEDAK